MIPKVTYGSRVRGLLEYLWGPGKTEEHVNPHLVAGYDDVELLAPQQRKQVPGFVDQAHTHPPRTRSAWSTTTPRTSPPRRTEPTRPLAESATPSMVKPAMLTWTPPSSPERTPPPG
ncbi:hypothetical protein [Salinispora arenicola]|uniref:hypothetical protein n=1 Tax=Salinispora arenicola TaxID=168697 RepID=UPI0018DED42B|nr:hypothetical protein [Salinispora arenicola]